MKTFCAFTPRPTITPTPAMAAAPPPDTATLTEPISLPTSSRPLSKAALEMMAVPCLSSWNTGMFMRRESSRSMLKHSGALMSSRLMPPSVGSSAAMISISLSGSRSASSMSNTSTPANFWNRQPLSSLTGFPPDGADVAQTQHRRAIGDHGHQIAAGGVIERPGRVCGNVQAGVGHAGRVGQRQIALVRQGLGGSDRNLAPGGVGMVFTRSVTQCLLGGGNALCHTVNPGSPRQSEKQGYPMAQGAGIAVYA